MKTDKQYPKVVLWLMNHTEMPLANLIGHGDVAARSLDEVRTFCDKAGLQSMFRYRSCFLNMWVPQLWLPCYTLVRESESGLCRY